MENVFHGIPWKTFHGIPCPIPDRIPWNSMEKVPWNSMEFHGIPWGYFTRDVSPIAAYGQSMVLSNDKELYVFGGTTGLEFNSYLYRYSFSNHTWEYVKGENPPVPRYRHESVCDGERFYVIGGGMSSRDPEMFFQLEKIQSFNFNTKRWDSHVCYPSRTHGFPKRRRCHGCVTLNSVVYICGGYDGVNIFDDIWSLDLATFQWEKLPQVFLVYT